MEPMNSALLEVSERTMTLIGQGAEGKVFATMFLSKPTIVKERVPKKYRVKELDVKLTLQRLRQEARCMVKCRRAGVLTPRYFLAESFLLTIVNSATDEPR
jgi:TP53 regulating kinase and related kinases